MAALSHKNWSPLPQDQIFGKIFRKMWSPPRPISCGMNASLKSMYQYCALLLSGVVYSMIDVVCLVFLPLADLVLIIIDIINRRVYSIYGLISHEPASHA